MDTSPQGGPFELPFGERSPEVAADAWVAPGVVLVGAVSVAARANLWFGVVARGDIEPIEIGPGSNVQDNVVLHTDAGFPLAIGEDVAIGHGAVVHGCTLEDDVLVGMNAVILSGAKVGAHSIVGAGSVVPEGEEIPAGSVVVGAPAKWIKDATPGVAAANCERYRARAEQYRRLLDPS